MQHRRFLGGMFLVITALVGLAASSLLIGLIAGLVICAITLGVLTIRRPAK